jgi:recombination associated protein RdgC
MKDMLARNARLYTFDSVDRHDVEETLSSFPWAPCGPSFAETSGFVPPVPSGTLVRDIGDFAFFAFRIDSKILPASVINDETDRVVSHIEFVEKKYVGRKRRRDIREEAIVTLLPKAFVRHTVTRGWFDFERNVLVIDATRQRAQKVIGAIIKRMPDATFAEWNPSGNMSAETFLSRWVTNEPGELAIGHMTKLVREDKESIRIDLNENAAGTSAKVMFDNGMVCEELVAVHGETSFVVDGEFGFKRIAIANIKDDPSGDPGEKADPSGDPGEKADAELVLSAMTVREIADAVEVAVHES